ncbi:MAG: DNA translocase FtsK [Lachnospiraceae bacterium]|nr:DNA translocase FtsK [Lachnospiraceae bacterium]MCM1238643.1 DNA translocase FtsK [Lachnospiraceae bacterium]
MQESQDSALFHEIGLIVLFVAMVLLFCCNFGIVGPVGNAVSGVLFGLFGLITYILPLLIFFAVSFWFANEGNPNAVRKLVSGVVLCLMAGVLCDLLAKGAGTLDAYDIKAIYENSRDNKTGGGVISGSISYLLQHYLETIGTVLVVLLCSVVSLILLTERSLLGSVKKGGSRVRELSREDAQRRREMNRRRHEEQEEQRARREEERARREEERRLKAEEKENEKILRMEKKVSGVMMDTALARPSEEHRSDDVHEIIYTEEEPENESYSAESADAGSMEASVSAPAFDLDRIQIRTMHQVQLNEDAFREDGQDVYWEPEVENVSGKEPKIASEPGSGYGAGMGPDAGPGFETAGDLEDEMMSDGMFGSDLMSDAMFGMDAAPTQAAFSSAVSAGGLSMAGMPDQDIRIHKEDTEERPAGQRPTARLAPEEKSVESGIQREVNRAEKQMPKQYSFPPLNLLQKGAAASVDTTQELKETAMRLQQTLSTFGVKVTITDISQGPSVTRYELQPEQGVKVSKIVGLADDIKLNLAATDIRIEAPIPGKAAIGIEVPNKETIPVALRDLLENKTFKDFPSNIAFAVGKDIAGQVVVTDIAKMPHMLIAGATGSGKSVCINTLIMSILYKAHPDDVKLIMVDPKVVELSVYNGIPHLLIPVVTDPKKASAALHWGVSEMEDRYRKFADHNVRDLKGYNKKVESMAQNGQEDAPKKLPQIVIIVDELADLMMVCPGEVEESICRLAQLARAAGIHLIIATQRPSVDVITGLIKANMPSRVAFSVSSGVDSRTILDMNGAEKLLGKGDMLFYPQGYSKPARVQGAFVSDREVSDVVDFLKNQALGNGYASEIEEKIRSMGSAIGGGGASDGGSEIDELFEKAGRFIIEKDKASIGMLQRVLKIGFNRAARIMDQLCEFGVVGEEEGTKPRKILMSPEQFEQLLEEQI